MDSVFKIPSTNSAGSEVCTRILSVQFVLSYDIFLLGGNKNKVPLFMYQPTWSLLFQVFNMFLPFNSPAVQSQK